MRRVANFQVQRFTVTVGELVKSLVVNGKSGSGKYCGAESFDWTGSWATTDMENEEVTLPPLESHFDSLRIAVSVCTTMASQRGCCCSVNLGKKETYKRTREGWKFPRTCFLLGGIQ
jgi:hypothetical protein